MSGSTPISFDVAKRVAGGVARAAPPLSPATLAGLEEDFLRCTAEAEQLVAESTGLVSSAGPARGVVTDRAGWVEANIDSFERLLAPLILRLEERSRSRVPESVARLSAAASGAEVGLLLGWMSGRVLGQYDLLMNEAPGREQAVEETPAVSERSAHRPGARVLAVLDSVLGPQRARGSERAISSREQPTATAGDIVYYVGPNIVKLEAEHGFDPAEFRLWIALHEVTHRLQFTGVPWLREYFLSLIDEAVLLASPTAEQLVRALRRLAEDIFAGRNPLAEAGLVALVATDAQREALRSTQALMSLLEGHGDVTMSRAASSLVPHASRFAAVLHGRRGEAKGAARFVQQLLGLDAKLRQYAEGERFVELVEEAGGPELFSRVWQSPAMLPVREEIASPRRWIERVSAVGLGSG